MPNCPRCGSRQVIQNGAIHNGKGKFGCKASQRQFVENPAWRPISAETNGLIDRVLLDRMALAGLGRVTGVSAHWRQDSVNAKYKAQRQVTDGPAQKKGMAHRPSG
jgi:insertion element IS1 protein InsB